MRPLGVLALILAFLAPAFAGCFGATESSVRLTPYASLVRAEAGRATELVVFVNNTGAFREDLDLAVSGLPADWTFTAWPNASLVVNGRATAFAVFGLTPAPDARHGPHALRLMVGRASTEVVVDVRDLGPEPARRGVGAHVRTVGFFENGTVFYSNMKEVRDESRLRWPDRAEADEASFEPLKVYVGGKRRTAPPEPYNASGYFPVIEGFDERLRTGNGGMRAGETLAVRVPKEKAYTVPGNEEHALYGLDLNFLIEVVSVDVLPPDDGATCLPETDVCLPPPR